MFIAKNFRIKAKSEAFVGLSKLLVHPHYLKIKTTDSAKVYTGSLCQYISLMQKQSSNRSSIYLGMHGEINRESYASSVKLELMEKLLISE